MLSSLIDGSLWNAPEASEEAPRVPGYVKPGSPLFIDVCDEPNEGTDISEHLPLLYYLAFLPSVTRILEIGTGCGYSTRALYAGLKHKTFGQLISVDILDCAKALPCETTPGVEWTFIQGHSTNDMERVKREIGEKPLDLVFLDGFHSFKQTVLDLSAYIFAHLRPRGLVVVHDTEAYAGVNVAVSILEKRIGWPVVWIPDCNGLAIAQKPEKETE